MESTTGTIISVKKQWWFKFNTKAVRLHPLDGAVFPHIIKVKYTVDGREYIKSKWLGVSSVAPCRGDMVTVWYQPDKPAKCRLDL